MGSQDEPKLVTTTIHAYDTQKVREAFKGQLTGIAMMGFMHFYMKFTNPLAIQVQPTPSPSLPHPLLPEPFPIPTPSEPTSLPSCMLTPKPECHPPEIRPREQPRQNTHLRPARERRSQEAVQGWGRGFDGRAAGRGWGDQDGQGVY